MKTHPIFLSSMSDEGTIGEESSWSLQHVWIFWVQARSLSMATLKTLVRTCIRRVDELFKVSLPLSLREPNFFALVHICYQTKSVQ